MKISKVLKHIFVPHEHNEYRPHFFREASVISILIVGVFMLGLSAGSSFFIRRTVLGVNIATSVLVDLTNENRAEYNQPLLTRNATLDAAATLKATDMVTEGYFAHESPKGVTPWHWFNVVGYKFLYAGENLAVNFTESRDVDQAWMDSPTHRANLLNVNFREIGMAVMEGVYKGNDTIFVVQMFGTPALAKESKPMPSAPPEATTTPKGDIANTKEQGISPVTLTKTGTSSLAVVTQQTSREVLGKEASTTNLVHNASSTDSESLALSTKNEIVPIVSTEKLAVVKTVTGGEIVAPQQLVEAVDAQPKSPKTTLTVYSTWYERGVFFATKYIDVFYRILLVIVGLALCIIFLVEFKKQHYKHILYGSILFFAVLLLLYINATFL